MQKNPVDVKEFFATRAPVREDFLRKYLETYTLAPIGADWASRRYWRVQKDDGTTFVLLESVPDHIPTVTMGHKLSSYLRIARAIKTQDIPVPSIYECDEAEGLALLEDFGSLSLYDALEQGGDPFTLYGAATDILSRLQACMPQNTLDLPPFFEGYIYQRKRRLVDWYLPVTRKARNPDGFVEAYLSVWHEIERSLPPCPQGFVHGDFHAQNLMVLSDGSLGILDFQDAYWGPPAFDLANLLEDIRRDIPTDVRESMLVRYGADETMRAWVRVMATQFHCSIIGQVLRLALVGGKPHLLKFIPRMQAYIKAALKDPVLAPLANWMEQEKVNLDSSDFTNLDSVRTFIRPDAF